MDPVESLLFYYHCAFSNKLNPFMTEAIIIQKPVHWQEVIKQEVIVKDW